MSSDYHYPGTTVLRNRLGYTDPHTLAQAEALIAATRMAELAANPIDGHFDFAHLQAIHRHLLGDLYEWAGEIRTIDTAPGDLGILHDPPAPSPVNSTECSPTSTAASTSTTTATKRSSRTSPATGET
ncbi:hypothetical protein A3852_29705 [Rhodococcus qingshengii]|nr:MULTISPECIES: hypothetical protein [Rhodococcus]KZL29763.1 hypothetical protein A3852_29705 [Rhodococcus qingshengii]